MLRRRVLRTLMVALVLSMPQAAHANVGIPMLGYAWPAGAVLLLPVIALEAFFARQILRTGWRASFKVAGLSNFISTLAGIPIAWVAVLLLSMPANFIASALPRPIGGWVRLAFNAAWLPPYRDSPPWC